MAILDALRRRDPFSDSRDHGIGHVEAVGTSVVDVRGSELVWVVVDPSSQGVVPGVGVHEFGLEPDPFDTWDPNTVHVTVDGRRIGKMTAGGAARFGPALRELWWRDAAVVTLGAVCADHRLVLGLRAHPVDA